MTTTVVKTGCPDNAAAEGGPSRRDLLRLGGLAGLALPATGGAAGLA